MKVRKILEIFGDEGVPKKLYHSIKLNFELIRKSLKCPKKKFHDFFSF